MDKHEEELKNLRLEIDELDKLLLTTLRNRFRLVDKISRVKKKLGLPAHQQARWDTMLKSRFQFADKLKLNQAFTHSFFKIIHRESKRIQIAKLKDKK